MIVIKLSVYFHELLLKSMGAVSFVSYFRPHVVPIEMQFVEFNTVFLV